MLGHFWSLLRFRKSSNRVPKPLSIFKLLFWNHFSRENFSTKTWAVSSNLHSKFLDKHKKYIFFSRNIKNPVLEFVMTSQWAILGFHKNSNIILKYYHLGISGEHFIQFGQNLCLWWKSDCWHVSNKVILMVAT